MRKILPKDWYDTYDRVWHINGYCFSLSGDAILYLQQQCGFKIDEARQFILSLEKI